jgi:hypothetical protein
MPRDHDVMMEDIYNIWIVPINPIMYFESLQVCRLKL